MLVETRETVIRRTRVLASRRRRARTSGVVTVTFSMMRPRVIASIGACLQVLLLLVSVGNASVFIGVCPTATLFPGVLAIVASQFGQLHPCPPSAAPSSSQSSVAFALEYAYPFRP